MADSDEATRQWRQLDSERQKRWAASILEGEPILTVDRASRTATLLAICPTCDHDFRDSFSDAEMILDDLKVSGHRGSHPGPWTGEVEIPFRCTCGFPHPGRPPELPSGCGAGAWFVDRP